MVPLSNSLLKIWLAFKWCLPRRCLTSLTSTLTPSFQLCSAFLCLGIPQKLCQHRVNYETGPRRGRQTPATGRQTERGSGGGGGSSSSSWLSASSDHYHRVHRVRRSFDSFSFNCFRCFAWFLPRFEFFFLVFYLFLFSFSLFSALFVLLVVYAAPSGG